MKDKSEQMPERIFDWLEQRDFSSLLDDERAEVLKYISADEYAELRSAAIKLCPPYKEEKGNRSELLAVFTQTYGPGKPHNAMLIWKVAAAVFLVCYLHLSGFLLKNRQHGSLSASIVHDTVFVMKETQLAAERIIDTVYLLSGSPAGVRATYPVTARTRISGRTGSIEEEMNTMNYEDFLQEEEKQKKNSIKHDTLLKKYPFVSIL